MAKVYLIGKKGSKACSNIKENTGINRYTNNRDADIIVNYGLTGDKLVSFFEKNPRAKSIPIINKYVGCSKLLAVNDAIKNGILAPESRLTLPKTATIKDWIEKKINSSKGIGIKKATKGTAIPGKYYQRMINERKYELRVHAFKWLPIKDWRINKRLGPQDQIAWNFHQGGHFSLVQEPNKYKIFKDAKDISLKILNLRNMAFGAVDFIVDQENQIYFIEINSSPGFEQLNAEYYFNAFRELKTLNKKKIIELCNL